MYVCFSYLQVKQKLCFEQSFVASDCEQLPLVDSTAVSQYREENERKYGHTNTKSSTLTKLMSHAYRYCKMHNNSQYSSCYPTQYRDEKQQSYKNPPSRFASIGYKYIAIMPRDQCFIPIIAHLTKHLTQWNDDQYKCYECYDTKYSCSSTKHHTQVIIGHDILHHHSLLYCCWISGVFCCCSYGFHSLLQCCWIEIFHEI